MEQAPAVAVQRSFGEIADRTILSPTAVSADRPSTQTYIRGRPPWYTQGGELKQPYIIGLAGGTACGKSTVSKRIIEALQLKWVVLLSTDSFYKDLPAGTDPAQYNFDSPDAIDVDELLECLRSLKQGRNANVPVYCFKTNSRLYKTPVYGADVIIVEGLFALHFEALRDLLDLRIFVDTDSDLRLGRRLRRDVRERGRSVASVLQQYERFVKPAHETFIAPTMRFADIILPFSRENTVGIELILRTIRTTLEDRGMSIRQGLLDGRDDFDASVAPRNLRMLDTEQVRALHTIIRDASTERDDFIFYGQRLVRLLIEEAISALPMADVTVKCPSGVGYAGKRLTKPVCGVSILRAGEAMEAALLEVCRDARIGKILIQVNETTKEPMLFYCRIPKAAARSHVILLDAQIGTGATAMMAIRVLLDHGVSEADITFVCLLAHLPGVCHLAYVFPQITIVASGLDPVIDSEFVLHPGMGSFGDRWFGTMRRHAPGSQHRETVHVPATSSKQSTRRRITSNLNSEESSAPSSPRELVLETDDHELGEFEAAQLTPILPLRGVVLDDDVDDDAMAIPSIVCTHENGVSEPV